MKAFIPKITTLVFLLFASALSGASALPSAKTDAFDIVVYGGSSSGVIAAVQGARDGKNVALVVDGRHVGGLTSGGLGLTDTGNAGTVGGLSGEFYHRVYNFYTRPEVWVRENRTDFFAWMPNHWGVDGKRSEQIKRMFIFEPHAAEQVFLGMLREAKVSVFYNERLDLENGVVKQGAAIVSIKMESGRLFSGKVFIDATYEGDLLAKAGVKYTVGRESNAQYNETLNGLYPKPPQKISISPFKISGKPSSGLLPPAKWMTDGKKGDADDLVQSYNFRVCLTDVPENRVPFVKPANYNPDDYELLYRWIDSRRKELYIGKSRVGFLALGKDNSHLGINFDRMPNRKTDSNDGSHFGSDLPGGSQGWPEGNYAEREKIWQRHKDYIQGLLWFLANDPRLPKHITKEVSKWGLAKDEFTDTDNWPRQLYVREARRMVSDYVMTEHDARGDRTAEDGIALASYPMDSHSGSYLVDKAGILYREPGFYVNTPAHPISYRSIRPAAEDCTNLLVTCCIASSHVAYGSIRMEPVLMMMGQSAAAAATIAIDGNTSVQQVPYEKLRAKLLALGQIIEPKNNKK